MGQTSRYHHGDLRAALIERAVAIISEEGVEALSLRALARDIGVSHAAPTRHFPSRTDLLAAIAREGVEALLDSAATHAQTPALSARARLMELMKGYVGWAEAHPVYHLILRNQDVMRHADAHTRQLLASYADLQRSLIEEAKAKGWKPDVPTGRILLQIVSLAAGLALIATDPLYRIPLGGTPSEQDIDLTIAEYFA